VLLGIYTSCEIDTALAVVNNRPQTLSLATPGIRRGSIYPHAITTSE
jgi:hypothetical protein